MYNNKLINNIIKHSLKVYFSGIFRNTHYGYQTIAFLRQTITNTTKVNESIKTKNTKKNNIK